MLQHSFCMSKVNKLIKVIMLFSTVGPSNYASTHNVCAFLIALLVAEYS